MDATTRHRYLRAMGLLDQPRTEARALRYYTASALAGVTRHGTHNQKSHGGDGVPGVDLKLDKLKLAGRIKLDDGEELVSSDKVSLFDGHITMALLDTPSGPRLRLGLVGIEDDKRWRAANLGGTVDLDKANVDRLRAELSSVAMTGKREAAAMETKVQGYEKAGRPFDFDTDITVAQGILAGGTWGDLGYAVELDDAEPIGWNMKLSVRPPDAAADWSVFDDALGLQADDAEVTKLLKRLDAMAILAGGVA